jgi:hypothetical protein
MAKSLLSIKVQMWYVGITGVLLLFLPNLVLSIFGIAPTTEVWIRILGLLVFILSILYLSIIQTRQLVVIKATIITRLIVGIGIIILSLIYNTPTLMLFAGVDIATAIWSYFEVK